MSDHATAKTRPFIERRQNKRSFRSCGAPTRQTNVINTNSAASSPRGTHRSTPLNTMPPAGELKMVNPHPAPERAQARPPSCPAAHGRAAGRTAGGDVTENLKEQF